MYIRCVFFLLIESVSRLIFNCFPDQTTCYQGTMNNTE
ncbi:hypothetical protein AMTRI_Chr13g119280 [Amborella trichopoda]